MEKKKVLLKDVVAFVNWCEDPENQPEDRVSSRDMFRFVRATAEAKKLHKDAMEEIKRQSESLNPNREALAFAESEYGEESPEYEEAKSNLESAVSAANSEIAEMLESEVALESLVDSELFASVYARVSYADALVLEKILD